MKSISIALALSAALFAAPVQAAKECQLSLQGQDGKRITSSEKIDSLVLFYDQVPIHHGDPRKKMSLPPSIEISFRFEGEN